PALLLGGWILVAPGVSSLWVRLGADDTVATVFLVLAFWAAAGAGTSRRRLIWDVTFVFAAVAAALSKEAFALAVVGAAAFRAALECIKLSRWRLSAVPVAAWAVLGVGVVETLVAYAVGASSGPLGYGGRYLSLPEPTAYVRYLAQNAAILVYASVA